MTDFVTRLKQKMQQHSPLCVGIDPSASLLKSCGLPDSAEGALEFGKRVLAAADYQVSVIKPQSAFFERFGSDGFKAMEDLSELAHRKEVLVLLDGKRGDIDTTGAAYAESYFGAHAKLRVDAVTTHAYLGLGALQAFFDFAHRAQAGVFVVVRSSNPEGRELQTARTSSGETVAVAMSRQMTELNERYADDDALGPIGAVVGATCEDADVTINALPKSFILAPGVGAQGATMQDVLMRMRGARGRVLPNVSRAILANGVTKEQISMTIRSLKEQANTLL